MFDRLDDMLRHYEELMLELNNPSVAEDQRKFRKLMKEQADLAPIVDAYKQYKQAKQDVEDSLALLDEESDEEMKELAKEELAEAHDPLVDLALQRDTVVLEFQEIVSLTEDLQVAFCSRFRVLVETFFQVSRDFTGKAGA